MAGELKVVVVLQVGGIERFLVTMGDGGMGVGVEGLRRGRSPKRSPFAAPYSSIASWTVVGAADDRNLGSTRLDSTRRDARSHHRHYANSVVVVVVVVAVVF